MKLWTISGVIGVALSAVISAADVQYSVIAFPQPGQSVSVSVGGQDHPLKASQQHPNLFTGTAPAADTYRYSVNNQPEAAQRTLAKGATSTGNEFFNRSRTVYDVPALPQAYNPIYPPLFTGMNRSNEVATIIMQVNATALGAFNKNPAEKLPDAQITNLAYISNQEFYSFTGAALATSGQSTKEFSKQSWSIDLGKFSTTKKKDLLFGRSSLKLRAEETDPTFAREKLMLDCLAAAGGATLSGHWVRVIINNEPYGLFLLMDDISTHFIDNVLHGGDWAYAYTGVTYKGNALSPEQEGNLAYLGEDASLYSADLYKLADKGEDKTVNKTNSQGPLVEFTRTLSKIDPKQATDAQHTGDLSKLLDPNHLMIHMALNFLGGSWDGLWIQASNYYLSQDLKSKQWAMITYDFDETFGSGEESQPLMTVAYTNYSRPDSKRPLIDAILQSPYYNQQFQDVLKTIVKRFFKPSVINPRLQAWTAMLKEDIAWTRAIPGRSPGTKTSWTVQDFVTNMNTTSQGTIGVADWVKQRSAATAQQLKFDDKDDLPALGPYTGGSRLDANGNVVAANGQTNVSPSAGGSSPNNNNNNGATTANGDQAKNGATSFFAPSMASAAIAILAMAALF
ncbi:hypothetical protein DFQ28_009623 [Apophysomyces sp. BC1034]|nr:hypothetical protein DFQ30_009307 [Apophysomyces sp. BC1015]KAG0172608.1 hypothetical protein DFQ29_008292 [Apophysomyces sp. BC1021]KAG0185273.1 hypothetical protein DFQ28_009623 [Apophysomyces sp. BC1034]